MKGILYKSQNRQEQATNINHMRQRLHPNLCRWRLTGQQQQRTKTTKEQHTNNTNKPNKRPQKQGKKKHYTAQLPRKKNFKGNNLNRRIF